MRNDGVFAQRGGSSALGAVSGSGSMTISGGDFSAGALAQKSLKISGGATVHIMENAGGASAIDDLQIARGSSLDLGNNALILRGYSPSGVQSLLDDGEIVTGAADPGTSLVIAENRLLGLSDFLGQSGLTGDDILMRRTWSGDADLNGALDADDFAIFAHGYGANGPASWMSGDFDSSGAVNGGDFERMVAGFNAQGQRISPELLNDLTSFATTNALPLELTGSGVPEPGSLAALWVGGIWLMRRRRSWRRGTDG
jgi:hypothetical protein